MVIRMFSFGGSNRPLRPPLLRPITRCRLPPGRRTSLRHGPQAPKPKTTGPLTPSLDPRLNLNELKETENTDYTGKGRNIFLAQANDVVIPAPVAPGFKKDAKVTPPPPPPVYVPPPPPPIDLKFFGFASSQGVKRVFLARGDDVFIASEGEIVIAATKS